MYVQTDTIPTLKDKKMQYPGILKVDLENGITTFMTTLDLFDSMIYSIAIHFLSF